MEHINWILYWIFVGEILVATIITVKADEGTRMYKIAKSLAWTGLIALLTYLYSTIWWGNQK